MVALGILAVALVVGLPVASLLVAMSLKARLRRAEQRLLDTEREVDQLRAAIVLGRLRSARALPWAL